MRKKKERMVTLVVPGHNRIQEFTIPHAERLLDMGHLNGGWELPADSDFIYSEEYGLRLKTNKGNTSEAE